MLKTIFIFRTWTPNISRTYVGTNFFKYFATTYLVILFPPNLTIFMQKKIGRKTAEVGFELIKGIFQGI